MFCYLIELQAWAPQTRMRCLRRVFAETPDKAAVLIGGLLRDGGSAGAQINVRALASGRDDTPPILRREDLIP